MGADVQSGIQHVVQTRSQSGRMGWKAVGPMLSIGAGVACIPQLLATAFAKDQCAEVDAGDAFSCWCSTAAPMVPPLRSQVSDVKKRESTARIPVRNLPA